MYKKNIFYVVSVVLQKIYKMPRKKKKKLNKYPKFYLYACDCECVNECKKVFF